MSNFYVRMPAFKTCSPPNHFEDSRKMWKRAVKKKLWEDG